MCTLECRPAVDPNCRQGRVDVVVVVRIAGNLNVHRESRLIPHRPAGHTAAAEECQGGTEPWPHDLRREGLHDFETFVRDEGIWKTRKQSEENEKAATYGHHGRMNLIGAFESDTGVFYGFLTSFKVNAVHFRRFICH